MDAGKKIQDLLDKPNPDFDPNSPQSKQRRALMQEDPVKDIRNYVAQQKASKSSMNYFHEDDGK